MDVHTMQNRHLYFHFFYSTFLLKNNLCMGYYFLQEIRCTANYEHPISDTFLVMVK